MVSLTSRLKKNHSTDNPQEMDIEESFRYVNFLLMWYGNRSSMNLANTIVSELERIKLKLSECEDGSRDEECEQLVMKAMKLFSATKGFKIKWDRSPNFR